MHLSQLKQQVFIAEFLFFNNILNLWQADDKHSKREAKVSTLPEKEIKTLALKDVK